MRIFVKGQNVHSYELSNGNSLNDLNNFICEREGISVDEQVIFFNGHILDEEQFSNLYEGTQLEVSSRLLGGKIHGSLARAGKVKGQTPKVEKQEKKRKKCGRARRRILFQKRFSSSINTTGKRRGPNSNDK